MPYSAALFGIDISTAGYSGHHFDRRFMRVAMIKIGRDVQKGARQLVSGHGPSRAGAYPAMATGALRRSITYRVSQPGFMVVVSPRDPKDGSFKTDGFYPSLLHYGVRRSGRSKTHRKHADATPWRISPRGNYMTDSMAQRKARAEAAIMDAVRRGITEKR
ncbi:MAG: hypothetical protein IPI58_09895 [Alphaproteobacteria bacterium]|nr:MAG: hypothetical protein IPI58_09895 [Alphaproteobacteria bacterium]